LVLSLFLAMLVGWSSASLLLAQTPKGVQCPTAPVQQIAVAVKSCCNGVVTYQFRKPRIGEKEFLQCRCAEKRSTQQQTDLDRNGSHVEMLPVGVFVLDIPHRIPEAIAERTLDARLIAASSEPPVPPPAA